MSATRPVTVNSYTWRNGAQHTPGVLLQAGPTRIFVPLVDAYALADQLVDTAENIERGEQA
ncbi:hypothetical protein [Kocuria sp. SM24M-10]|uniref:hypothetical protein n=1 Tax=Kocuria sp. SM24M-10 TaxID=1660349 RepID=UPI000649FD80|nr:hypothetical protein [Kocuria sp. SM24M-10]KLU08090.1 hypothetical protein ABL57_19865 [Kocuria sp. SM24M-10]